MVVVLGEVERGSGLDLRVDQLAALFGLRRLGLLGQRLLRRVVIEDHRQVLLGGALDRGIVGGPVDLEQLGVARALRIEVHLRRLGVVTEARVGRVRAGPPAITHAGPDHARLTPKLGVGSPKSPQGKGRGLNHRRCNEVDGGQAPV